MRGEVAQVKMQNEKSIFPKRFSFFSETDTFLKSFDSFELCVNREPAQVCATVGGDRGGGGQGEEDRQLLSCGRGRGGGGGEGDDGVVPLFGLLGLLHLGHDGQGGEGGRRQGGEEGKEQAPGFYSDSSPF